MKTYFDEWGMPLPANGEPSDNGILFLAELFILKELNGTSRGTEPGFFHTVADQHNLGDNTYAQAPHNMQDPGSHDNQTAIMGYYRRHNHHKVKELSIYHELWHPRDFIFYSLCRRRWYDLWAYLFIPVLSIIMIVSQLKEKKVRNGIEFIHTDGKLLNFVRYNCVYLPITKMICEWIAKLMFGERFYENIFTIYFKDRNHPCVVEARRYHDLQSQ